MSFYEDFIEEGHACAACLEFFTEEVRDGVLHGVGYPRLCRRCEDAEEERRVQRNQREQKPEGHAKRKRR